MTDISSLSKIVDQDSVENIQEMTSCFVRNLDPLKVILFGSFANGTYTDDSDYDFYIVVDDGQDIGTTTNQAYRAVRHIKRRPVDIVVGTNTRFEKKSRADYSMMVEGEVFRSGILLYDQADNGNTVG